MLLFLNKYITTCEVEEGIALFNSFTGNTHFLPSSFNTIIVTLIKTPSSKEALLTIFLSDYKKGTPEQGNANEKFQQFITEALKSGIIIETN